MNRQPQLVFLPGLAGDVRMWRDVLSALPPALPWVVSAVHQQEQLDTIETMASALLESHPGDLVLVGASMGGMLSMEVARQAPQRVVGLALLGTTAQPESAAMRGVREAAIRLFEQGRLREVIEPNVAIAFHPNNALDGPLVQAYLDFVLDAGPGQLVRQNQAVIHRPDARLHLPDVTCPALVLCGEADRLTPPACSNEITQYLSQAEYVVLRDCGHMLTMEQPKAVAELLLQWFRRHGWWPV